MKPIIGVSIDVRPDEDVARSDGIRMYLFGSYCRAVVEAGGVPVGITPYSNEDPEEVLRVIDGWLITGGLDIDPTKYGQQPHATLDPMQPMRFKNEEALLNASKPEMPILGICYGTQFLNVTRGGTLYQHLPDLGRTEDHAKGVNQRYSVDSGTRLHQVLGSVEAEGPSYHHQAVDKVGAGLQATAYFEDGTIEAIEDTTGRWMVGVQWHPERRRCDTTFRLFDTCIDEARRYREGK